MKIQISMVGLVFALVSQGWAYEGKECLGKNRVGVLPIDNSVVAVLKKTKENQFLTRAHVKGVIHEVYPDKNGHYHFGITLGNGAHDRIEVVYNKEFGPVPPLEIGAEVEACGDYINSYEPTDKYPRSPDDAIIHWVHMNPDHKGHSDGFIVVNNVLCGQEIPPKQRHHGELQNHIKSSHFPKKKRLMPDLPYFR